MASSLAGGRTLAGSLHCEELEFIAEEFPIKIVPKFTEGPLYTIAGMFGPFMPGIPVDVPLWIALRLKDDQQCHIICPEWLQVESLTAKLATEQSERERFTDMPFHYIEVAWRLLNHWAREDIPSADRVATLVQDVETTRREKMQRGVNSVLRSAATEATPSMIDLTNASAMEVNALRSTFCKALDYIVEAGEMDREASRRAAAQARSARMLAGVAGAVPLGDGSTPGNPRSLSSSATPGTEGRTRTRIIGSPVRAPDFDADTGMGGAAADGVADDDEEYGAGGAAQPPGAKLRRFR